MKTAILKMQNSFGFQGAGKDFYLILSNKIYHTNSLTSALAKGGELSLSNCEELFKQACSNCQNGCPVCGGYGWIWSSEKEIEVVIEIEKIYDGLDEMAKPQYLEQLKLDENGCLILKRK
jgi:hypothetical protein